MIYGSEYAKMIKQDRRAMKILGFSLGYFIVASLYYFI